MKKLILTPILLAFSMMSFAQSVYKVDLSVFPKPEKGMHQVVIEVPTSENDYDKKIEIFAGKFMETDTCNRTFLAGEFKKDEVKGFGYDFLTFSTKGMTPSTLMGCLDNKKISQFVKSQGYLTNYNGRMPIVVYVPDGYDVRFKIYRADADEYLGQNVQNK